MGNGEVFRKFQWRDKSGFTWNVEFCNGSSGFSGYAVLDQRGGTGRIHLQANSLGSQQLPMAFQDDVHVDSHSENRGLGSMLFGAIIEECMLRGHKGICGNLSESDRIRFPKLKHFYEKLGFSVYFYDNRHPEYGFARAGKIEMIFDNTSASGRLCPM